MLPTFPINIYRIRLLKASNGFSKLKFSQEKEKSIKLKKSLLFYHIKIDLREPHEDIFYCLL